MRSATDTGFADKRHATAISRLAEWLSKPVAEVTVLPVSRRCRSAEADSSGQSVARERGLRLAGLTEGRPFNTVGARFAQFERDHAYVKSKNHE